MKYDKAELKLLLFDFVATFRLGLPIVIGQLGIVLMGVVDTAMIGRVGKEALAAAGVSNAVFFMVAILGIGLLNIMSPIIAEVYARRAIQELRALLVGGFWAATISACCLAVVIGVMIWHFEWFGQSQAVTQLSRVYLLSMLPSLFPMYWFLAFRQFTDGMGMPRLSMYTTLMGLVLNVLLNYILIFGNWGVPALGLLGAGLATWGSRCFMAFCLWIYLLRLPIFASIRQAQLLDLDVWRAFRRITTKGIGTGLQQFFEVATFALAAIMMGWISDAALAAHQIALNMASVTYMISTGIAVAGSIRVGNALGRMRWHKVRRAGSAALLGAFAVMGVGTVVFLLVPGLLVRLYTSEAEVVQLAVRLLLLAAFFQLSDGIQAVGLGILRGLQDVFFPTLATLVAYWGLALPTAYYLGIIQQFGAAGIWFGLLIGLTAAALFLSARFYYLTQLRLSKKKLLLLS